jgi:hypothetical protein
MPENGLPDHVAVPLPLPAGGVVVVLVPPRVELEVVVVEDVDVALEVLGGVEEERDEVVDMVFEVVDMVFEVVVVAVTWELGRHWK